VYTAKFNQVRAGENLYESLWLQFVDDTAYRKTSTGMVRFKISPRPYTFENRYAFSKVNYYQSLYSPMLTVFSQQV
jgi:hypothetical protein